MAYCSEGGGIGNGILERIPVFKLSIVEPTDSTSSQSLTRRVDKTLFRNDGKDKVVSGRISKLPVPQSQLSSTSGTKAHLPISPLRANTISPLCNTWRANLERNSSSTVQSQSGYICPSL